MPFLTVSNEDGVRRIPFVPGPSVREILENSGIRIRSSCRGNGACGLCLVRVESGEAYLPSRSEQILLSQEQIEDKIRFACQLIPKENLSILIVGIANKSNWRTLVPAEFSLASPHSGAIATRQSDKPSLGLAVDMGTTHVSLSLWDFGMGARVVGRVGSNPQSRYGSDVVSRLIAAGESQPVSRRVADTALDFIAEGLKEMCCDNGLHPGLVTRVAVVGNTAMLMLLTETDPGKLLQPSGWTSRIACRPLDLAHWTGVLEVDPKSIIDISPPLAGFVGSDLLAGMLDTGLTRRPLSLLIDFGTNSEIALWDGFRLWVTSAAGGPAFESSQVQCGMPAEPGAICHVNRLKDSGELDFEVIGGGEAKGICGSGLVDLIACLRRSGELANTGRLSGSHAGTGFVVPGTSLRLSHHDIDMFQRAKAGIGAGIETLLKTSGANSGALARICVCGVFGRNLNLRNAQEIGLLPDIAPYRVELCGNTALAGCERLLTAPQQAVELEVLRTNATIINLSNENYFESRFLENLFLAPMKDGIFDQSAQ
jgi:uncharacterized 2Fe-2S/4Fe-4S cluster protein (DUF4445 family)